MHCTRARTRSLLQPLCTSSPYLPPLPRFSFFDALPSFERAEGMDIIRILALSRCLSRIMGQNVCITSRESSCGPRTRIRGNVNLRPRFCQLLSAQHGMLSRFRRVTPPR